MFKKISEATIAFCAVGALFVSIWNTSKISDVHILLNSRLTELLDLTKQASKAEGLKEGREELRR